MSKAVKSVAYVHTADIDPTVVKSGAMGRLANICVTAAEKPLDTPPKDYTPTRRNSLTDILRFDEGDAPFDPALGRARRTES